MSNQIISSGVTSSGLTVSSGNELLVLSGGVTDNSTVLSGGTEFVSAGGLAANTRVSAGGVLSGPGTMTGLQNHDYGSVSGVLVGGGFDGGTLIVESGGVASGVTINRQGIEFVALNGSAGGTVV